MLIHGKDDVVVPYVHSIKMADGLKDHDKPHEFVTLAGEDHWLSLPKTRMEMLEASMRFIQKHNPAD
jgi:dipeptidyl aminopeptidase/acylaminoacyl peptidase